MPQHADDQDDEKVGEGGDDVGGSGDGEEGSKILKHGCKIPNSGRCGTILRILQIPKIQSSASDWQTKQIRAFLLSI